MQLNKVELERRIAELVELIQSEKDADKLLKLLGELDSLLEIKLSNDEFENPPPSAN